MATWTDLLVRDSPQDTGQIPSPGLPYTSPDIICTQTTTYPNPTQVFTANYGSDPNLAAIANQNNYFYTRAKNLGTTTQGGTMYLYWAPPSLLMTPNQWIQNAMYIVIPPSQKQYFCALAAVAQNGITVQQTPFVWAAPSAAHYCAVGICSTSANPWNPQSPPTFPTWEDFVLWVRNNGNVGWRNLQMVTNPNIPEWDSTAAFQNQWQVGAPLLVSATANANVPANTSVTLKSTALGINTTGTVGPGGTLYSQGVTCPAGFTGYVETIAQTPNNIAWPSGATLTTTAYLGATSSSKVARFAADFGEYNKHPHVLAAKKLIGAPNGVLVQVGNNSVGYQPTL
jgi:hypothetical protein